MRTCGAMTMGARFRTRCVGYHRSPDRLQTLCSVLSILSSDSFPVCPPHTHAFKTDREIPHLVSGSRFAGSDDS